MSPTKKSIAARKRYNRIAPLYDLMEGFAERSRYSQWRQLLWSRVEGDKILEIGVGTGKNFPYYPSGSHITAIDLSDKMLERARQKARKNKVTVNLQQMDVEDMTFPDEAFDSVAGTFIFCSVPHPVRGLEEVRRVVKQGGKVILLEHVLSANRILASLMNLMNPLVVRTIGPNINRRTVENVKKSGLIVEQVTELGAGIFKIIEARKLENKQV